MKPRPVDPGLANNLGFLFSGCDAAERIARLREMRALIAIYCGWNSPAKLAIDRALNSGEPIAETLSEINSLPALTRRRLLSSYGALTMDDF
jgi:hypothetical protein